LDGFVGEGSAFDDVYAIALPGDAAFQFATWIKNTRGIDKCCLHGSLKSPQYSLIFRSGFHVGIFFPEIKSRI
jgi:hypothetical protein